MRGGTRIEIAAVAAFSLALVAWTAAGYPLLSVAFVVLSLGMAIASLWSCRVLFGRRAAWTFVALGMGLGWFAEQMGSSRGWFFGDYTYTEVLGPRLGDVPLVIPCMWFGLPFIGLVLASLALWRRVGPPSRDSRIFLLTALLAAMIVTAFDLGADPYFVYQLKAWIMTEKDGGWFGETVRGFEGWMLVSFVIVAAFIALARPQAVAPTAPRARTAALLPIVMYAFMMAYQLAVLETIALRVIAFFAMGIPVLIAAVGWHQWSRSMEGPR